MPAHTENRIPHGSADIQYIVASQAQMYNLLWFVIAHRFEPKRETAKAAGAFIAYVGSRFGAVRV